MKNEPLFSPSWYRVASLRPRLRSHAKIHRHRYRDETWFVLQDRSTGRFHRFSPAAHHFVGLLDGERTVSAVWERTVEQLGDDAPTQEEVIRLLGQLHAADMLQSEIPPDALELFRRGRSRVMSKWKQRLASPLALRFGLFDPDRLLRVLMPFVRPIFTRTGAVLWTLLVLVAALLAAMNWSQLTEGGFARILSPHNLLILWLTYPVVKTLHEFGHAFATRAWGGEVHEMGVMLLVLMPIPYVDASAASAFAEKERRIVVDAAGIMVELALASIALFVWLEVEAGLISAIAFNVMLIAGVSTLLFNGNPLLRFDGYYILCDLIEIPNLGTRANRYLGYLCQRYLFGFSDATSPVEARGERAWFVGFGIASFIYRIFIIFTIVLYVAGELFFIGVVMAVWAAVTQIILPVSKAVRFVMTSPQLRRTRTQAVLVCAVLLGSVTAGLVFVPVSSWSSAEGVLWLPEDSRLRAGTDGFVAQVLVKSGERVRQGDAILLFEDPLLDARVELLEAEMQELRVRHAALWVTDRVQADIVSQEMNTVAADLKRTRERVAALRVVTPIDGRVVIPRSVDLLGRFVRQGEQLAYVLDDSAATARVVVPQGSIALVRDRTRAVQVRLAQDVAAPIAARIRREVPAASDRLPSVALGTAGGGQIPVDPADGSGLKTFQRVFQFELELPESLVINTVGGRLYVRFDHGAEPLASQWYRAVRQLLLRRLAV